jgi:hypothetical protein
MFDYGAGQGDPDLFGVPTLLNPDRATASYAPPGGKVTQGVWFGVPSEFGPYSAPAATGLANMTLTANTKAFDPTVATAGEIHWLTALDTNTLNTFQGVLVEQGKPPRSP